MPSMLKIGLLRDSLDTRETKKRRLRLERAMPVQRLRPLVILKGASFFLKDRARQDVLKVSE